MLCPARRRPSGAAPVVRTTAVLLAALVLIAGAGRADAHGFTSIVYAQVTAPRDAAPGEVQTVLHLEYDLLVVSAADAERDDALFGEGDAAFRAGDMTAMAAALTQHADAVLGYVDDRFRVTAAGDTCSTRQHGAVRMEVREDVPYAILTLRQHCPEADEHEVASRLFPDEEEYVRDTKTIVTYDLDLVDGSAALDAEHPSFSTHQSTGERFWEFFRLGAEHLLLGIDHILFLLALIAGSRRLREIVLAATTFTLAHSVTFVLAALGLVQLPARLVEPVIALSIAVVGAWHLWRLWRRGRHATDLTTTRRGHLALDRAGWSRLVVVFGFGLVHGLGFAGALGIDAAFSWTLLWSLLVFNIGIETVQIALIVVLFPLLALLRHRAPVAGLWVTGAVASAVTVMGLVWFVERALAR